MSFEKFADRARRVVVLSQDEAKNFGHNYIGTEHLLLALIREGDGVAARALALFDVDLPFTRAHVEDIVGSGDGSPSGQLPFHPRCKKAFDNAFRSALELEHEWVNTEHVLLGLIRDWDDNDPVVTVLEKEEVDRTLLRQEVIRLLSEKPHGRSLEPGHPVEDTYIGRLEAELSGLVSSWTATYEGDTVTVSVAEDSPCVLWKDQADRRCGSYAEALEQFITEIRYAQRLEALSKVLEPARALRDTDPPVVFIGVPIVNEVMRAMLDQVISRALAEAHALGYHGFDEPGRTVSAA